MSFEDELRRLSQYYAEQSFAKKKKKSAIEEESNYSLQSRLRLAEEARLNLEERFISFKEHISPDRGEVYVAITKLDKLPKSADVSRHVEMKMAIALPFGTNKDSETVYFHLGIKIDAYDTPSGEDKVYLQTFPYPTSIIDANNDQQLARILMECKDKSVQDFFGGLVTETQLFSQYKTLEEHKSLIAPLLE